MNETFDATQYSYAGKIQTIGADCLLVAYLQNDNQDKHSYVIEFNSKTTTTNDAINMATDLAKAETRDDSWAMDEWKAG